MRVNSHFASTGIIIRSMVVGLVIPACLSDCGSRSSVRGMTAVLSEGRIGVHAGDEQARLKIDLVHKHGACLSRDTSAQCDDLNHWIVIFGSAQVDLLNSDGLNARFRAAQEDLHPRLDIAIGDNEADRKSARLN